MSEQLTIPATPDAAPEAAHSEPVAQEQPETVTAAHQDPASIPVQEADAAPSPSQPVAEEPLEAKPEPKKRAKKPKVDAKSEAIAELESELEALKANQEKSAKKLSKHEDAMRSALLDKLGIRAKFRDYAPKVDPFSDKGKADLEAWAAENPELRESRPVPTPEFDVSAQVKSFSSPHLVSTEYWKDSVRAARGTKR